MVKGQSALAHALLKLHCGVAEYIKRCFELLREKRVAQQIFACAVDAFAPCRRERALLFVTRVSAAADPAHRNEVQLLVFV